MDTGPSTSPVWAYKNKHDGIFLHNSWNLGVYGGLVADNRHQIRIHRAYNVTVEDVGQTDLHQKAIECLGRSVAVHPPSMALPSTPSFSTTVRTTEVPNSRTAHSATSPTNPVDNRPSETRLAGDKTS